jgi:hypothetical protein
MKAHLLHILFFCFIPVLVKAQHDVLVLEKRGLHVRSYTVGDPMTFMTVYGQWFNGTIDDLRRDTVYISGQAFSYKEIGAISRERTKWSNKVNGTLLATAGVGLFIIGAVNGGLRGDQASQWYTTSGIIVGSALIAGGVILVATAKKYYKLGGKFKLQYLQIGR